MVERKNLELSVRDFGPIARADIDLRPMTVFVGPSNTGKSYLAILIYALHKSYSGRNRYAKLFDIETDYDSLTEHINELIDWIDAVHSKAGNRSVPFGYIHTPLPDSVSAFLRPLFRRIMTINGSPYDEIVRCLGITDAAEIIRHSSRSGANISIKPNISGMPEPLEPFEYNIDIRRRRHDFLTSIPDDTPLFIHAIDNGDIEIIKQDILYVRNNANRYFDQDWTSRLLFLTIRLLSHFESYICHPLNQQAYYLPAGRTGIMQAHRVAVGSLIRRASYAGIQHEDSLPLLSGVLADFIEQITSMWNYLQYVELKFPKISEELARMIEQNMLKGEILLEESVIGYPIFSYRPDGWKEDMPLMNTSSSVSELAPLVLYLRHLVQPGQTLIIEEPESHLHPAMQVEFTRQLAAVVRAGVRVIITTHSEWVLDELANLVRVSGLPKSRREGIGGADYALTPEQLGVWLFEPKRRPRGSVVKEIPFDEDFGGFRSGFSEVAMGTYNDYAAISNRLGRSGS